jgi:NADPH-dependent 2,4-dienoyl-CoA reductase/sulfur reductase-like enzyme
LSAKRDIAIYGGGLVAVEMAEKLTLAGHSVTMIVRSSLLRRYLTPQFSKTVQDVLIKNGVKVRTDSSLQEVSKNRERMAFTFTHGEPLIADLFLIATGVDPNRLGPPFIQVTAGGLRAGKHLETNLPDVYAAGDVAAAPDFFGGENEVTPILPEALEQGRVAGCNMAGQKEEYRGGVSWNFLRCFDGYVFNIGQTGPEMKGSCEVAEGEEGAGSFRMIFQGSFLIGIECANIASLSAGAFGYLITRRVPVDNYRDLLAKKPGQTASRLMLDHRRNQSGMFTAQRGTK